jgi:hypothetical protein
MATLGFRGINEGPSVTTCCNMYTSILQVLRVTGGSL